MHFIIAPDDPCLPGHFPGRPLVPGVVLLDRVVEAAEAAGAMPGACWQWSQVKFLRPLLPGQSARVVFKRDGDRWRFRVLLDHVPLDQAPGDDAPRDAALLAAGEMRAA